MKIPANEKILVQTKKLATHDEVRDHIENVFGSTKYNIRFVEKCICNISFNISDRNLENFIVTYDKIFFEMEGREFFWPIQKYSEAISVEEGKNLIEMLRR